MKRYLLLTMVVLLGAAIIFSACAAPAPAPAPAPSPAPAPAPAPKPAPAPAPAPKPAPAPAPGAIKPIVFTVATQAAPTAWNVTEALNPWMKNIEQASNGKVKFEPYYAQTLVKTADMWQAVATGVADIADISHVTYQGVFPVGDVMTLPFLSFKSNKQASGIYWKLYEKYPAIMNEFKPQKVLFVKIGISENIMTSKRQVKTIEDFKGMKFRAGGGVQFEIFKALGAVPFVGSAAEVYESWQKGVFEGAGGNWDFTIAFRLYEIAKYYTLVTYSTSTFSQIMNMDKWNSLPPDIKEAFNKYSGLTASEWYGYNMFDRAKDNAKEIIKKQGFQMIEYTPPETEVQRWRDATTSITDAWVKNMTAKGAPAKEILDFIAEQIKTYNP